MGLGDYLLNQTMVKCSSLLVAMQQEVVSILPSLVSFFHLFFDDNPKPHFCKVTMAGHVAARSANVFASALLMPKDRLSFNIPASELINKTVSVDTALRLEQLYGVSHSTLIVRLKELKLISSQNAESLINLRIRQEASLRGYDRSLYHKGNENLVFGDYGSKAKRLFDEERISEGHSLELMRKIGYGESEDNS